MVCFAFLAEIIPHCSPMIFENTLLYSLSNGRGARLFAVGRHVITLEKPLTLRLTIKFLTFYFLFTFIHPFSHSYTPGSFVIDSNKLLKVVVEFHPFSRFAIECLSFWLISVEILDVEKTRLKHSIDC